jgi:hypothetical protein
MDIYSRLVENDRIWEQRKEKMFGVNNYPVHLQKIVEIILDEGENLTDGIEYYADYDIILQFADRIYKEIKGE